MTAEVAVEPEALAAFLGLGGPGGYVGIVGGDTALAGKLIGSIPSVHFVLINPPTEAAELPMLSLLRANSIPIKSRSLRGVLLLSPYAEKGAWRQESERVVLPGLRIVGQGDPPQDPGLEVLASAGDWWVAHQSAGAGSA
jgi:hypothetical protein